MRTTINISNDVIRETEVLYGLKNRSKSIEAALIDAIHAKKLEKLKALKGKIHFDEEAIGRFRGAFR